MLSASEGTCQEDLKPRVVSVRFSGAKKSGTNSSEMT
jgi:hypothetical protein